MIKIKTFVPSYFKKFRCIADKCPDTCCIGWEVDIDNETAEKYPDLSGVLSDKIKKHLIKDEDGCNIFTLCENDRCPFLNEEKLCEIHMIAGEKYLSKTCRLFPRFFDDFGSFREMGLGFGCPEAAKIILENEEKFSLVFLEKTDELSEETDEDFLQELIELRTEIFSILEDKKIDFKNKIEKVLILAKDFQKTVDGDFFSDENQGRCFDDCVQLLLNMEYIKPEHREFIKKTINKPITRNTLENYEDDFIKLIKYYVFRYMLKAVYDFDILTKIKYGVFAMIIISRIYSSFEKLSFEDRVKIMCSFSKEVEYSDRNMELLDEAMLENFSTEDLLTILFI